MNAPNDDDLLKRLGAAARREEGARDPDMEALTLGDLDPESCASLEARAREDDELARKLSLHRPLSSAQNDALASAVLSSFVAPTAVKPHRSPLRRAVPIALAFAAAAAIALFAQRALRTSDDPLPPYAANVAANVATARAPSSAAPEAREALRLDPEATFELVASPDVRVRGDVTARAFLVRDGVTRAWSAPLAISESGSVRIVGRATEIFPETRGRYTVVVAIGRQDALPTEDTLAAREDSARVRVVRADVVFVTR